MTDPVITRVKAHISGMEIPKRPFAVPAPSRRRSWLIPVAAGLAVIVVLLIFVVRPSTGGSHVPASGSSPGTLPRTFAPYSYLTASVSSSPPGPAIALYQQGLGVELGDFPQALVLGAHADIYRRGDLAEDRSDSGGILGAGDIGDQGDPAPMLLAPDGRTIAVGSHQGLGNLILQDLTTGARRTLTAEPDVGIRPLSWSSDGRYIVALRLPESGNNQTDTGQVVLFDLQSEPSYRDLGQRAGMAVFSPDTKLLALGVPGDLRIVDLEGREVRKLTTPDVLTSRAAWSPDGRYLVLTSVSHTPIGPMAGKGLVFIDATGAGEPVPASIPEATKVLGWTQSGAMLVRLNGITEIDPASGQSRLVAAFDESPAENYMMGDIQLASTLIQDYTVRDPGSPDRGPWPTWLLVLTLAVIGPPTLLVTWIIHRRRKRKLAMRVTMAGA